jgi:hypothetical protein
LDCKEFTRVVLNVAPSTAAVKTVDILPDDDEYKDNNNKDNNKDNEEDKDREDKDQEDQEDKEDKEDDEDEANERLIYMT